MSDFVLECVLVFFGSAVSEGIWDFGEWCALEGDLMKRCVATAVIVPEAIPELGARAEYGDMDAWARIRGIERWFGLREEGRELRCVTCSAGFGDVLPRGFVLIIPQYVASPDVLVAGVCERCFVEYERDWRKYCLEVTRKVCPDAELLFSEVGRA
jgi:hypothetical protein